MLIAVKTAAGKLKQGTTIRGQQRAAAPPRPGRQLQKRLVGRGSW